MSRKFLTPVELPAGSTAPTPSAGDNSTKLATTAYVEAAVAAGGGGVGGNVPPDVVNTNYTFVAGDKGRCKVKTTTSALTYTINNSVHSAGDTFSVGNFAGSGLLTIAAGTGVTLYLAGSTGTANRVVGVRGMATVYMYSASEGYIFGAGVG